MQYEIREYELKFRRPFSIAHGTRTHTPVVFLELHKDGKTGYGEAALPPYLPGSQSEVSAFIRRHERLLGYMKSAGMVRSAIAEIMSMSGPTAAKACMEMAMADLSARLMNISLAEWLGIKKRDMPDCAYTISACPLDDLEDAVKDAAGFRMVKVKLNGRDDVARVQKIRNMFDGNMAVDANMGWSDLSQSLETAQALKEAGVLFIEQPFPATKMSLQYEFFPRSPLPVIADEAVRNLADLELHGSVFHGINVKLMKSPGLLASCRMIEEARKRGMKVLVGCMSESSCGVAAAAALASLADWCDLDGPLLISNDPFSGVDYENGKVLIRGNTGTGAERKQKTS